MGGNTGEIQIGSERELYKHVNHQAGTTKASTRIILLIVQMYNILIFRLLIGAPDHSYCSESSCREEQKLIGFHCYYFRGASVNHRLMWKTYLYTWP